MQTLVFLGEILEFPTEEDTLQFDLVHPQIQVKYYKNIIATCTTAIVYR